MRVPTSTLSVACPFCQEPATLTLIAILESARAQRHDLELSCPLGHVAPTEMLMPLWHDILRSHRRRQPPVHLVSPGVGA